jgi:nucleolar protein 53
LSNFILLSDTQVDAEEEEEESGDIEATGGADPVAVRVRKGQEKKTQTDRNREKRRRDAEDEQAAKQRLKKQRRELDSVKQYHTEIAREEALQAANATRKAITKREKALTEPPKLGKHKFQPANVQVRNFSKLSFTILSLTGCVFGLWKLLVVGSWPTFH